MMFFVFASGGRNSEKRDRFSKLIIMITLCSVLPTLGFIVGGKNAGFGNIAWGFPYLSYIGFSLILLGIIIHVVGILTLKEQWTAAVVILENHKLIDTGIYHFIRHPIYAAILLELFGFGLALANWMALLMLLIPNIASLTYRIYVEEKALEKYFGTAYNNYEQKTKRLIPGIF
jgi:protein-S-isoprenylcysteine O-methyltransferase Ste14